MCPHGNIATRAIWIHNEVNVSSVVCKTLYLSKIGEKKKLIYPITATHLTFNNAV